MSDQEIQPGVIVLGMHRSGISAVTQLLEALGIFVGEDHDLKEKSWQNLHGFFERLDIRGNFQCFAGIGRSRLVEDSHFSGR